LTEPSKAGVIAGSIMLEQILIGEAAPLRREFLQAAQTLAIMTHLGRDG
jgi:hypothetical protein